MSTPKEAADKLRPDFHLAQMPPEDRHHVKFVEDVAGELGVEPTPFNLQQVAHALDAADIHGDDLHFPMMFYSRQHHAVEGIAASTYYPRHDMTGVIVENEDQFKALGDGWVENPADLPPRGEPGSDAFIPIAAPPPAKKDLPEPDHRPDATGWPGFSGEAGFSGDHFDPSNPAHTTRVDTGEQAEIAAEQVRLDAAQKAAADERERMARLQKAASRGPNDLRQGQVPSEQDAAAEMARRATLQQAATESLTETANLGRGTAVDGTTTRRNPDGLQADTSQPGNIRQVKNELS
jgi:hypothetical protein